VDVDRLVADLSAVRASRDREAVLTAIRTHVPEMRIRDRQPDKSRKPTKLSRPVKPIHSTAAA
jgi:hypothetical protein